MPGPAPSPNKVGRHTTKKAVIQVEVLPAVAGGAPEPPAGLPDELAVEWAQLWDSPLAGTVATTDLPALRRLFSLKAVAARYAAQLDTAVMFGDMPVPWGLTVGSQGQLVKHPALDALLAVERSIAALEDRFGLTTKSRQAMGIRMGALAEAESKVEQRARAKETTERADPRLADPQPASSKPRRPRRQVDGGAPVARRGRS